MKLCAHLLGGRHCHVEVLESDLIGSLFQLQGVVWPESLRIVYKGMSLDPLATFGHYRVKENDAISIKKRLRAGIHLVVLYGDSIIEAGRAKLAVIGDQEVLLTDTVDSIKKWVSRDTGIPHADFCLRSYADMNYQFEEHKTLAECGVEPQMQDLFLVAEPHKKRKRDVDRLVH